MTEGSNNPILDQYDRRLGLYADFTGKLEELVKEVLRHTGVEAHTVTSRVKKRESLRQKIARPDKSYSELGDVTDIAGVRIVTYFAADVDRVARCLEAEFDIDWENSIDRRAALDPDRFGYLSLHYVAELSSDRTALFEYGRFSGLKVEIQARSILQHAWAEIEHDLGYKTREGVPSEARRRFSALAGMLEIADREFRSLREELEEYERRVPERIEKEPQLVEIDKASLSVFIANSPVVARFDAAIASAHDVGITYFDQHSLPTVVERHVVRLRMLGVGTIQELEAKLCRYEREILAFAAEWMKLEEEESKNRPFLAGVSIFYLEYLLVVQTRDLVRVRRLLDISETYPEPTRDKMARELMRTHELIVEEPQ